MLLDYCAQQGIVYLSELSRRALDQLTAGLLVQGGKKGPLSKHSVHAYMRAVNHFLRWAHSQGQAVNTSVQLPKLPKKLVNVLSREEIGRLEEAAAPERGNLIIRVLADTGIRASEPVGLRLSDLLEMDWNGNLKVRVKGSKDPLVPAPRLYRRLNGFAEHGQPEGCAYDPLFATLRRPPGEQRLRAAHLPLASVRCSGPWAQQTGITKWVYPHPLRHSHTTWALVRGVTPITLAQELGHSSLAMIENV